MGSPTLHVSPSVLIYVIALQFDALCSRVRGIVESRACLLSPFYSLGSREFLCGARVVSWTTQIKLLYGHTHTYYADGAFSQPPKKAA